jgi:hypothetical protein
MQRTCLASQTHRMVLLCGQSVWTTCPARSPRLKRLVDSVTCGGRPNVIIWSLDDHISLQMITFKKHLLQNKGYAKTYSEQVLERHSASSPEVNQSDHICPEKYPALPTRHPYPSAIIHLPGQNGQVFRLRSAWICFEILFRELFLCSIFISGKYFVSQSSVS